MVEAFQLVTANRLHDGEVVYLAPGESWAEDLESGLRLVDKGQAEAALAAAARFVTERVVVNPYLIEVTAHGKVLKPARMREVIRAAGPTVRRDLGKQAPNR
jgi:hypothetical protein